MDDCDIFGGTVVNTEQSITYIDDYNNEKSVLKGKSTTPTCQMTETTCMTPWWHAETNTCDLGCSQSGGKLQPADANMPNGEKTCAWNDTTDECTYKYKPTWAKEDEEFCDNFCQTNSGTLTP